MQLSKGWSLGILMTLCASQAWAESRALRVMLANDDGFEAAGLKAVMAARLGVPAIAVSVGLDMAQAKAKPTPFASTVAAYPWAGELVARVIAGLADSEADTRWFAKGYITLSVLRPDWNATPADTLRLTTGLGALEELRPQR